MLDIDAIPYFPCWPEIFYAARHTGVCNSVSDSKRSHAPGKTTLNAPRIPADSDACLFLSTTCMASKLKT